jgi:uncharacterized membrane protein HdeD (DUF308 family)
VAEQPAAVAPGKQKGREMPEQTSQTSPQSVRADLAQHEDELKQAVTDLKQPGNGQLPPNPLLEPLRKVASYWWVELLLGIFWVVIAVVVLKFNHASVTTVGVLTGIMFLVFAAQEFLLAYIVPRGRWVWAVFGVLLTAAGIVSLINPRNTFAGFADILGFVFLLISVLWMVQAFTERAFNDLWWLTLIAGIMMGALAFWVSGQYFLVRAYTLLIFAGIWAMTAGVIAIVRSFQIRELGQDVKHLGP